MTRIAHVIAASLDPLVPTPVNEDYQVIIRSNVLANSTLTSSSCFRSMSTRGDPAKANAAAEYPETGIYRVEGNSIDTAGFCPYSGQFNNGIAPLGGASDNLIEKNAIKGGDVGTWLNGISAITGNMIRGNFLHDGRYGIKMKGNVRKSAVDKSTIYHMTKNKIQTTPHPDPLPHFVVARGYQRGTPIAPSPREGRVLG